MFGPGLPKSLRPDSTRTPLNLGDEGLNALRLEADNRRNQRKKRSTSASVRVRGRGGKLVRNSFP